MNSTTTDPNDPRLGHGTDEQPCPQHTVYLVLSERERAKGFVKPYRDSYRHINCDTITTVSREISETYARNPWFYGSTYCCGCHRHRPLREFVWSDGEPMDPHLWPVDEVLRAGNLLADRKGDTT